MRGFVVLALGERPPSSAACDPDRLGFSVTWQWYTTPAMETALHVRELGHVALFVRDLDATRRFYRDILGLKETGVAKGGRIVFFSAGVHHHDISCELARAPGPGPQSKGVPGLYHIAFDVGHDEAALAQARAWVEAHGLTPFGETSRSFSVRDPDGHEIELYVAG
jgi:catechol 2,3-dioxygenase-like lactoylglutathione lyase family enzyme